MRTETTLSEQARMTRDLLDRLGPEGTLACIAAEEFYVLEELESPYPFLRLKVGQGELGDELIEIATGLSGCDAIVERTRAVLPVAFVISERDRKNHDCVNRVADMLAREGYRRSSLALSEAAFLETDRRAGRSRVKRFAVYLPPGSGGGGRTGAPRRGSERGSRPGR